MKPPSCTPVPHLVSHKSSLGMPQLTALSLEILPTTWTVLSEGVDSDTRRHVESFYASPKFKADVAKAVRPERVISCSEVRLRWMFCV